MEQVRARQGKRKGNESFEHLFPTCSTPCLFRLGFQIKIKRLELHFGITLKTKEAKKKKKPPKNPTSAATEYTPKLMFIMFKSAKDTYTQ